MYKKECESDPLVSIVVITYNSSAYVIETLESAKAQTYQNIELIISDDCSQDNTVELCRDWLNVNKNRFVSTILLEVEENTGIAPNCNRGLVAVKGEWVKLIAGDDILQENCVDVFVKIAQREYEKYGIFVCSSSLFYLENNTKVISHKKTLFPVKEEDQMLYYVSKRPTIAPFVFFNSKVLKALGGFNEKYKMLEDFPFFFTYLQEGFRFYFIEQSLVLYRISESSISNSSVSAGRSMFKKDLQNAVRDLANPYLIKQKLYVGFLYNVLAFSNNRILAYVLRVLRYLMSFEFFLHVILLDTFFRKKKVSK